ncbi:MAG: glycosyltransferase family 2 protein [Thermodesulfobacteriota bacterium]
MDQPDVPFYSVVIPVFDEAENLRPLAQGVRETLALTGRAFEVIFVDDGSTDNTLEILRDLHREDPRMGYLRLDANSGQSTALWAGLREARGQVIITMDGDLQNDPHDIPILLDKLDRYDACTGWRQQRRDPWLKRISTRIANSVRDVVTMEQIRDTGCGFKAFHRRCLEALVPFDGLHRFIPTLLRMRGLRVCEVPIPHHPRRHGVSKYNIRNRLFRGILDLYGVRWLKKRRISYQVVERGV